MMQQVVTRETGYARNASESAYPNLWRGLVGWWCPSINPRGGNRLFDLSPYQNHGTLTNMTSDDWVVSGGAGALDFDGSDDGIRIKNSFTSTYGTLSFWIRTTTDSVRTAFAVQQTSDFNNFFAVYIGNNASGDLTNELVSIGRIRGGVVTIAGFETSDRSILFDGNWHNVVIGSTGVSYFLFIDGQSRTMTFTGGTNGGWIDVIDPTDYSIGCRLANTNTPNLCVSGQLDDVRLYNRALTPPEIRLLASKRGIGLQPRPKQFTYYQFPSGSKRRRLLTGMT
jgi:hypothetical protein